MNYLTLLLLVYAYLEWYTYKLRQPITIEAQVDNRHL